MNAKDLAAAAVELNSRPLNIWLFFVKILYVEKLTHRFLEFKGIRVLCAPGRYKTTPVIAFTVILLPSQQDRMCRRVLKGRAVNSGD